MRGMKTNTLGTILQGASLAAGGFVLALSALSAHAAAPGITGSTGPGADTFNLSAGDYVIEKGDRIAQLVVARYEAVEWEEGGELGESQRGAGGFGSSGR